ncbi:MAG: HAMP domain-containing histidine kinase [Leptolyngbya sp. SIOISBB]|nr:HAMP domain-containing histidine kinase [Leptolyngbya sp. SIOISBB]
MASGATRIRDIVQGLKNFSRLDEAGLKAVDLHESIDSTLLMLENRLHAKGHRPAVQVQKTYGQLPPVECYPGQINQALMSILTNAIDVFDEMWASASLPPNPAPPTLAISTQAFADAVLIMIEDNGPGMADAVKAKLYDPFFTTKPVGQGTGLGLAISHQIITQHQGILQCVSELGQGTEFSIKLPIQHLRSTE